MKNSLYIFDFDDTLAISDSKVKITNNGVVKYYNSHEFATYQFKPGDEMDASDFTRLVNPQIIKKYFDVFLKIYKAVGRKAMILTARGDPKPVKEFLDSQGMTGIQIVALGSINSAADKRDWIERAIKRGVNDILFVDDAAETIAAVKGLRKKYPTVRIDARLAVK